MRKPKSRIFYHGRTFNNVTFSIDGQRYTYTLRERTVVDSVEHLAHKVSLGKALAFAKSRATATEKHR